MFLPFRLFHSIWRSAGPVVPIGVAAGDILAPVLAAGFAAGGDQPSGARHCGAVAGQAGWAEMITWSGS
jgi:hypothetical protein